MRFFGGAEPPLLNRYWRTLWAARADVREMFPEPEGANAKWFAQWRREHVEADERAAGLEPGSHAAAPPRPGVNLVGYLDSGRGLGEAGRQIRAALAQAGIETAPVAVPAEADGLAAALGSLAAEDHPHDLNLFCLNADMMPAAVAAAGPKFFAGRRSVGLWFWEVSAFPERWLRSFDALDEVWVASGHVAAALRPVSPVPVRTVRMPIVPAPPARASRAELGMPEGFCFLFVFDYRSVFARKNPLGAVRAFCRAFAPGEGPSLAIKSVAGESFPAEREELRAAAAERPEIHLLEGTVSAAEKNAMIASCDCYLSLHRSEGLGLTIGEAMYFGRPTIATGYSGNLDFMTAWNSFPVRFELTPVGPGAGPYPAWAEWAEPDLDHAAKLMRRVHRRPRLAAVRGRWAAAGIRRTHSPAAAARIVRRRVRR